MDTNYYLTEQPKKRPGFLFILFLVIVGSATLGVSISAGYVLLQSPETEDIAEPISITSVHINPLAVPINPQDPNISDIIPLVKDAVVSINVTVAGRPFSNASPGSGSGFIFYEDDEFVFIATNSHVIENANTITISLNDVDNMPAHIVGYDSDSDLAVIATCRTYLEGKNYVIATLGDSSIMRMGDTVLAIGNAMGGGQVVTKGIVSALDLNIEVTDPNRRGRLSLEVMQTDAAVNRGNSGGPLLNHLGEVIGIVTAKQMGADIEGMGYAIPINIAYDILLRLKTEGPVSQPFIGIGHEEFSEFMRSLFNMPYSGILVRSIFEGSPAQEAGLRPDDLIIYFGGVRTYGRKEFVQALSEHRPGDNVTIIVHRDEEYVEIELTLGAIRH